MQKTEYYSTKGLSSSSIKDFQYLGPNLWKEIFIDKNVINESKTHFNTGSLLDFLMLSPDEVDDYFYSCPTPTSTSDIMQKILEKLWITTKTDLLDVAGDIELEDSYQDEYIISIAEEFNYGNGKYSKERVLKEVRKQVDYYNFLKLANGRVVISLSDNLLALEKKNVLLKTDYTKDFFIQKEGEYLYHHLQIVVEEDIIGRKGELDILRIVPEEKTIYIADLKTTHTISSFIENVRKFSYATQIGFYRDLVWEVLWKNKNVTTNQNIEIPNNLKDYKIICCNIVIDDKSKVPQIFRYSEKDLEYYKYGSEYIDDTYAEKVRYRKGWRQTIEEIRYHIKSGRWDLPKSHIENGYIELDLINGNTK